MINVVIVDDDPLVRTGLGLIVGGASDIAVVAEASDGEEAVRVVAEHRPDLVLMDIRMPRRDGLEATHDVLALAEAPRVLVLTTFDSDDMVLQALAAGASGFLLKSTPPAEMIDAIRRVAAGETTLSPSVVDQVVRVATASTGDPRREDALADMEILNEREREVALGIGRGMSNAEIAATCYMSIPTVKAHITHIFDKWGVDNRVQVAIRVHDAGLV